MISFMSTSQRITGASLCQKLVLLCLFVVALGCWAPMAHASDVSTECAAGSTDSSTLQGALNSASLAYIAAAVTNGTKAYYDGIEADNKNNTEDPHDDIKERKCLRRVLSDYFNNILDLLSKIDSNWIANLVKTGVDLLVKSIIEKACTWVAAAINSALSSICLPLPSLGNLTFSLPSLSTKSCNGISLKDLISVTSDYGSSTSATLNLSIPNAIDTYTNMSRGLDPKTGQPVF